MFWRDPFQLPRAGRAARSTPQGTDAYSVISGEPERSAMVSDDIGITDHRSERFPRITWNPRLGIYEGHDSAFAVTSELGIWTQSVVLLTAIWSLCELPVELLSSQTGLESAACIAAKLIWIALSIWTLHGSRAARAIFAFCCSVSVLSIASGLLTEQRFFVVGFCLSAVECAAKAAAFLLIVWPTARRVTL